MFAPIFVKIYICMQYFAALNRIKGKGGINCGQKF